MLLACQFHIRNAQNYTLLKTLPDMGEGCRGGRGAWRQGGRESRKMGRGEQRDQQTYNKSGKEEKGDEREERGEKGREKCIGKPQGHIRVA